MLFAEYAGLIKQKIAGEVKDKLLYLEIDVASRHLRSFIGINVSFVQNFSLKTRHLACYELTEMHSWKNLADEVEKILSEFGITMDQIYCI